MRDRGSSLAARHHPDSTGAADQRPLTAGNRPSIRSAGTSSRGITWGARIASLPTITEEIFGRKIAVDYAELKRKGEWLAARLASASTARVTSAAGTDIVLRLNGRALSRPSRDRNA
jgi:leucyl aminopeptidase (aminopeptidase T)